MSKAWAVPTWLFLHTLAAHLPESQYQKIKGDVLFQIKNICAVLPCPDCAQHASDYMAGVKESHIPTKEALTIVLWKFHNTVNIRTNKPVFPLLNMDIYQNSNLRVMYNIFLQEFTRPVRNPKLMIDVMNRNRIIARFRSWMHSVFGF
jgi:hypothetical protein